MLLFCLTLQSIVHYTEEYIYQINVTDNTVHMYYTLICKTLIVSVEAAAAKNPVMWSKPIIVIYTWPCQCTQMLQKCAADNWQCTALCKPTTLL